MKKRLLSALLALCMVVTLLPMTALAATISTYANSLDWKFIDGILTISGRGKMTDFDPGEAPWYSNSNEIQEVVIKPGITSVGANAFCYCYNLVSVFLPEGVTSINRSAFLQCENLTNISIPDGVTDIGEKAFYYCTSITQLTIPKSVKTIGYRAFQNCRLLTSIVIPESVTTIGVHTFTDCRSLTSISLPTSLTSIGGAAFTDCNPSVVIYYAGSEEQWKQIEIDNAENVNVPFLNSVTIYYNSSESNKVDFPSSDETSTITFNGHQYMCIDQGMTWPEAKAYCEALGGYLATITSAEEQAAVELLIQKGSKNHYWLGASDAGHEGTWEWITGEKFSYSNWDSANKEPTNGIGDIDAEHYLQIYRVPNPFVTNSRAYSWNDITYNCYFPNETNFFNLVYTGLVCEWDYISDEGNTPPSGGDGEIELQVDSDTISVGDEAYITAFFSHDGDFQQTDVTWTSSNENVVSVVTYGALISDTNASSTVTLKGVSPGTATITVSLADGRSVSCEVKVGTGLQTIDFDMNIYRAEKLLNEPTMRGRMLDAFDWETPCAIYIPALQENGFETWEIAWILLTTTFDAIDNPSSLYDFAVQERDVYSAIILNMLEATTEIGIVDSCEATIKDAKSYVSEIRMLLKVEDSIETATSYDFQNMTAREQELVKDVCEKFFKEHKQADIESINKVFSNIGTALEIADCLETYIERIGSAVALVNMSESLKTVVRTMYNQCPESNIYLKMALLDCVDIIDSSTAELLAKLWTDEFAVVGVGVAQYLVKELWKEVKNVLNFTYPYLDILLAGYKTGKFVSNTLFSTDSTIEQYCVMLATIDVENLMYRVYQALEEQYQLAGDAVSAAAYLSAVDVMFSSRNEDCESAYKFVDILDDAVANRIGALFDQTGANQRENIKNSISSIQTSYALAHNSILTNWVNYLDEDYPESGLYENYYYLLAEGIDRVANKKYLAECPVDVYVYDGDDLVAYVIDNKPYCSGDISVIVEGDTKTLYFYGDGEYRIEYVGNDVGTMDITITEYGTDGETLRDVYFYDIPLTDGQTYETNANNKVLGDVTYSLNEENGKTTEPDLDTYQTNKPKRTVNVQSGSIILDGDLFFETKAYPGEQIDIYAYVPEGYVFEGWFSDFDGNIFADKNSYATTIRVPDKDVTVWAVLRRLVCTITFNPNGGTLTDVTTMVTSEDGKLSNLPTDPSFEGHTFVGWFTGIEDGNQVTTETVFTEDTTIYAHWTALEPEHHFSSEWNHDENNHWHDCTDSDCNEKSGLEAHKWDNGEETAVPTYEKDGLKTYTCTVCQRTKTENIPKLGHHFSTDWAKDDDYHWHECTDQDCNETSGKAAHTWNDGEITVEPSFEAPGVKTYTCSICSATKTGSVSQLVRYTVTFDANGGTLTGGISMTTDGNGMLASLPTPTRNGYTFDGWYTDKSSGTEVTTGTTFTKDTTVYAHWTVKSSGGGSTPSNPSYQIIVPTTVNGTVTVTPTSAKSGAKVTITATPDEGYTIDSVTVTRANGNEVEVIDNGDGTYTFVMPASKVTVTATFTAIETPWVNPFTDVSESDWFYDGVAYVVQNGLMIGVGNQQFNPSGTTGRGMIVTILYRLEGEPTVSQSTFTDVEAEQYYTDAVAWAEANKIVEGYGNNAFGPNDDITREQIVTILYNYAAYKGYDVSRLADLSGYTDKETISDWALTAMRWANSEGLMTGRTTTALVPKGKSTRAETATILMRFRRDLDGLE